MRGILTYHSIDESGSVVSTSPATFRRHIAWLASGAVRVVSLDEITQLPDSVNAVALTFDDGMRSVGEVAAPLLAEYGFVATVFVVTGLVGRTNRWDDRPGSAVPGFPLLSWDELGNLRALGFEVGAHTQTHAHVTRLMDDQLHEELGGAHDAIASRLGVRPRAFAYPYGAVDSRSAAAVGQYYRTACTTVLRPLEHGDNAYFLPRLDAFYLRAPGALERWGSTGQRWRLAAHAAGRRIRNRFVTRHR
jgi:peptidoglycan/xylan/chitin deacetylase (PgdA/CDA1 family)